MSFGGVSLSERPYNCEASGGKRGREDPPKHKAREEPSNLGSSLAFPPSEIRCYRCATAFDATRTLLRLSTIFAPSRSDAR
jgi:hypothetical protein